MHPPEFVALLNACRAHLWDDTPRLILADWLDEHDDPEWATFIRVQCELARPSLDGQKLQQLRTLEAELLHTHWDRWAGGLPQIFQQWDYERTRAARRRERRNAAPPPPPNPSEIDPASRYNRWFFERGLLYLKLRSEDLLADQFLSWLESPDAERLMQIRTEQVDLSQLPLVLVPPAAERFLALRVACRLNPINPRSRRTQTISPKELREQFAHPSFELVRDFRLYMPQPVPQPFQELLTVDFSRIHELRFDSKSLPESQAVQLLKCSWNSLAVLRLEESEFGSTFWPKAFKPGRFPNLRKLIAYRNHVGDSGAKVLAKTVAHTLTHLELMNCDIGDAGFIALLESPMLEHLAGPQLNFCMNQIGDRGIAAFAEHPGANRFIECVFRENVIGDEGAIALAESPHLAEVTYLDLWKNCLTDRGAQAFAESPYFQKIQALNLRDNAISAAGQEALRDRFGDRVKI